MFKFPWAESLEVDRVRSAVGVGVGRQREKIA